MAAIDVGLFSCKYCALYPIECETCSSRFQCWPAFHFIISSFCLINCLLFDTKSNRHNLQLPKRRRKTKERKKELNQSLMRCLALYWVTSQVNSIHLPFEKPFYSHTHTATLRWRMSNINAKHPANVAHTLHMLTQN